ncbi:MAG: hypothetical protein ABIJ45_06615 [Candidatus Zixiibacteriota bacterium]
MSKPFTDLMISIVSEQPGVYFLMDKAGDVIYIGVAKNPGGLRRELRKHYFRIFPIEIKEAYDFDAEICNNPIERCEEILAEYEAKFGCLPKYNQQTVTEAG